jgi:hypothetical protein
MQHGLFRKKIKRDIQNVQPVISVFYSYAHLPSCLDALPTSTPTTSPQPSSPWQYTEMYSTGMTHQSVEDWVLLDYLVHTKMAFMHGNNEDKKKAFFFAIACAAYCLCLCHSWYMVLPQTYKHGHVILCLEP